MAAYAAGWVDSFTAAKPKCLVSAQCLLLGATSLGKIMADTSTGVIARYAAVG